jgi:hypothetical protein
MKSVHLSFIDPYLYTCYPYYYADLFICIAFLQPTEFWTGKQLFSVLVKVFLNLHFLIQRCFCSWFMEMVNINNGVIASTN